MAVTPETGVEIIDADQIADAFNRIEEELLESMFRNLERHTVEEAENGFEWTQWQAAQIAELERYARNSGYLYGPRFIEINAKIEDGIRRAFENGHAKAEAQLLQAAAYGFDAAPQDGFLRMPKERMDALIKATRDDMVKAEYATLRKAEDVYRKTIFDAQVYATSGAGTYAKAIDMATHDFVAKGINGIRYRNGSWHGIEEYSRMAVRTATKRAAMVAEGDARRDWGVHTVFVNYRADACPECMQWVGRVLIDDVYGGGTAEESKDSGYPLLSEAMAQGLFHPNCEDTMSTYFEGISELPEKPTEAEMRNREQAETVEQWRDRMETEAERNERLSRFSLDFEDKRKYADKADEIEDALKGPAPLTKEEADAVEWYVSGEGQYINQQLRGIMREPMRDYEREAVEALDRATDRTVEVGTLWRSVDASAIFGHVYDGFFWNMEDFVVYGEGSVASKGTAAAIRSRLDSIMGRTFTEKGFMSTTKDMQTALDWRDFTGSEHPIVLEIKTGGAAKGLDIGKELPELEARMEQDEVLLARDSRFRVTGYRAEQGQIVIEVELENEATETVADRIARGLEGKGFTDEQIREIADIAADAPETARRVFEKHLPNMRFDELYDRRHRGFYSPSTKGITIDLREVQPGRWFEKPWEVLFHEYGHLIDGAEASRSWWDISEERGLGASIKKDVDALLRRIKKEQGYKSVEDAKQFLTNEIWGWFRANPKEVGGVTDLIGGATKNKCCGGMVAHGTGYWNRDRGGSHRTLSTEAFAEFYQCEMANPEALERMKHYFPNSYELFQRILEEIANG